MDFEELNEATTFLKGSGALVSMIDEDVLKYSRKCDLGSVEVYQVTGNKKGKKIMRWGKSNNLPYEREQLIQESNIVPPLIATKRNITVGGGLMLFEETEDEKGNTIRKKIPFPDYVNTFLKQSDHKKYFRQSAGELLKQGNVFTEFRNTVGGEIFSMKLQKCTKIRSEEQDVNGEVKNYYWAGKWANRTSKEKGVVRIPAYNPLLEKHKSKFIYHTGDDLLCTEYYNIPVWWGSREWILLANCIPHFHLANLKHGYTIRWHIEIPKNYFLVSTSNMNNEDAFKRAKATAAENKKKFLEGLNSVLAGVKNAGRGITTTFDIEKATGKAYPGIKITPLTVDLKDEALLKLFESSNQASISSQAIHPTLANIESQGKMSSGSEIRNAFLMYIATQTQVPRDILLEPLEIVRKINKWAEKGFQKNWKFGFKDIEITALDQDKSGSKEVVTA